MRRRLAALEEALAASENRDRESQARIADLGSRLNVALAQRVQELARYRSDFFGRLRQILGNRQDIRIVGDRFVFQSEVLFPAGQASLRPEAGPEIDRVASAILELNREIPPDIPWVLRVDGHTDQRPIATAQFPSNWALSSARAIAVVQALITRGVPPQHLVAAGLNLMRLRMSIDETTQNILDEIDHSVDQALKEIRVSTYLLHPPNLATDGRSGCTT